MVIASAALARALETLVGSQGFAEIARDLELDAGDFARRLAAAPARISFSALLALVDAEPPHSWAARVLVALLALRGAGAAPTSAERVSALEIGSGVARAVDGSLIVDGNLRISGRLAVAGDLAVRGHYQDRLGSQVVVGGSLSVGGYLRTEGFLAVGGALEAALVYLDFNQGFTKVLDGCRARLLIESDHGRSRIFGPVAADYLCFRALRCDAEPAAGAERLGRLLVPDLAEPAGALEGGDLAGLLIALLDDGQPVFRAHGEK